MSEGQVSQSNAPEEVKERIEIPERIVDKDHSDIVDALAKVVLGADEHDESDAHQKKPSQQQNSARNEKHSEKEEPNDPLWWSPLDKDDLDLLRSGIDAAKSTELLFTNEEIAEALEHIGDEEELGDTWENSTFETDREQQLSSEELNFSNTGDGDGDGDGSFDQPLRESVLLSDPVLPELNFEDRLAEGEEEGDEFLLPSNELGQIFDAEDLEPEPIASVDQRQQDPETLAVLQQLEALSLDFPQADLDEEDFMQNTHDIALQDPLQQEQDTLPLYCQPCDPEKQEVDHLGDLDKELLTLNLQGHDQDQYASDIDNMLSQLSVPDKEELLAEKEKLMSNEELLQGARLVMSSSVMAAAQPFLQAFRVKPTIPMGPVSEVSKEESDDAKIFTPRENISERHCLGHRERILSVRFSPCGNYMATASADSTIRVWRPARNQLLASLSHHDSKYECLRVAWGPATWLSSDATRDEAPLLATAGADGNVYVLKQIGERWDIMACIDHTDGLRHFTPSDPEDKPQIYSLQFIENWEVTPGATCTNKFLLTSSEDHVHIWEVVQEPKALRDVTLATVEEEGEGYEEASQEEEEEQYPWHFKEVFSIGFGDLHSIDYGICVGRVTESSSPMLQYTNTAALKGINRTAAFGGERNPDGDVFVFDASYCTTNGMLGVALSDGSLRLLNGRGECLSVLQLPGANTHLTSFCWDSTGTKLATSVAGTGHVVTWEILLNASRSDVQKTSCQAILGGGHTGTVFGTFYCGSKTEDQNDPLLLSWGVDGRVSVWHAETYGEADFPIATLVNDSEYPIFGLDYHEGTGCLALVGGSGDGGFIGIPAILYDIEKPDPKTSNPRSEDQLVGFEATKKARTIGDAVKIPKTSTQTSGKHGKDPFATALYSFLDDCEAEEEDDENNCKHNRIVSMKRNLEILQAIGQAGAPLQRSKSVDDDEPPLLRLMECLAQVYRTKTDDEMSEKIDLLKQAARLLQEMTTGGDQWDRGKAHILHNAARRNQVELLRFACLDLKWDVNSVNQQGMTALQFAARSGKLEALQLLLSELGADPNLKDRRGQTALDAARANNKDGVVEALNGVQK